MTPSLCTVTSNTLVAPNTYVLAFRSPEMAGILPGQFVNIRVSEWGSPLLRRPFSVYHARGDELRIIFDVVGAGTLILSLKKPGDTVDVLGPLGRPYGIEGEYEWGYLVSGGLGVAPLPMIDAGLRKARKNVATFLGARSSDHIVPTYLRNIRVATDDGSEGFYGTVVELLESELQRVSRNIKIFACGPNPMLERLAEVADRFNVLCEASVESIMGCGMGICQGCPVRRTDRRYSLICTDGPVFDTRTVEF